MDGVHDGLLNNEMIPYPTARVPHGETNPQNDLRLRAHSAAPFHISDDDLDKLQETINEHALPHSWSTYARFTITLENPIASSYLQRGIGAAIVVFAHFSELLPTWAVPVVAAFPAIYEAYTFFTNFHERDGDTTDNDRGLQNLAYPLIFLTAIVFSVTEKDDSFEGHMTLFGNIVTLSAFLSCFISNCFCTIIYGKDERDFKFQLANLRQLLEDHPELEDALQTLRHHNSEDNDNAFVDSHGNLLLSPFYFVIHEEGASPVRYYLQFEELLTMTANPRNLSECEVYCDRPRFEKILKTFKEALSQSETTEEDADDGTDVSIDLSPSLA